MSKVTSLFKGLLISGLLLATQANAIEVAGVQLDDRLKVGGSESVLNGAGIRTKVFFKVYVAALYVGQKSTTAAPLMEAGVARRMSLVMLRDLDADSLLSALKDGLAANHSDTEMAALKPQVDQLGEIMMKIGAAKTGNVIDLDFGSEGLTISFNKEVRGKVTGAAFNKAMLKIWLGDNPADSSLKKALLGS